MLTLRRQRRATLYLASRRRGECPPGPASDSPLKTLLNSGLVESATEAVQNGASGELTVALASPSPAPTAQTSLEAPTGAPVNRETTDRSRWESHSHGSASGTFVLCRTTRRRLRPITSFRDAAPGTVHSASPCLGSRASREKSSECARRGPSKGCICSRRSPRGRGPPLGPRRRYLNQRPGPHRPPEDGCESP